MICTMNFSVQFSNNECYKEARKNVSFLETVPTTSVTHATSSVKKCNLTLVYTCISTCVKQKLEVPTHKKSYPTNNLHTDH